MKKVVDLGPALDITLIDYIRIATFDSIAFWHLCAEMEKKYHEWRPHKWQQYKGRKSASNVFHGIGRQKNRAHYIAHCSGAQAHYFWRWFNGLPDSVTSRFYATRIDLQRTKNRPLLEHRIKAYRRLRGTNSLIQSKTGITLYIGARTSDTYWRLYDKTESTLRCEIELKGKQVKRAWMAMEQGESLGGIFNRFLKLSRVPNVYVKHFWAANDAAKLPEAEKVVDLGGKLEWLKSLDSLVYKLANDHDTAESLARLIDRWAEYAEDIDRPGADVVKY